MNNNNKIDISMSEIENESRVNKNMVDENKNMVDENKNMVDENKSKILNSPVNQTKNKIKGIRKKIKDFIVNKHVEVIKKSGIPLELACLIIKIVHFRLPFDLFLAAYFSSPFIALCLWIFVMGVFSCFLLLDGCVISSIEYKLTGNSLNVMDIFLWMFKKEPNFKNRYMSTIIAAVIYLTLFLVMVYNKGCFNFQYINKLMYFVTFSYITGFVSKSVFDPVSNLDSDKTAIETFVI